MKIQTKNILGFTLTIFGAKIQRVGKILKYVHSVQSFGVKIQMRQVLLTFKECEI